MKWADMRAGQQVRFVGFTENSENHRHWSFTPGRVYPVATKYYATGPVDEDGCVPVENWGFEFELVS